MAIATTTLVAGAIVVGASAAAANSAKKGAEGAAAAQRRAIEEAQGQLAESNVEAAGLIAAGQHAAAGAILQAGEAAAAATLEAAALARHQIERFFKIAKDDIDEKLAMSRADIESGRVQGRTDINAGADAALRILDPLAEQGLITGRELASMIGIADDTGTKTPFDSKKLEETPQFQFQYSQGLKAIDRGTRSKLSGGQKKELQAFGNGLASNTFNDRISQLLNLYQTGAAARSQQASTEVGRGQALAQVEGNAAGLLSAANQNASGNLASAASGAGQQQAQVALSTGNALSNIALSQGGALAQNATQSANALAANQQAFGQNSANLSLGLGTVNANEIAARSNANAGFFNTIGSLAGFGVGGGFGSLYSASQQNNNINSTSGGSGVNLNGSYPNNRLVL
jgi:hypothetical protein